MNPMLRDDLTEGVCKEPGTLARGYGEKSTDDYLKGKNTVLFMGLDKIKKIPKYQVVTHVRIVVDYRPQTKKDPNRVRITVGGNITNFHFELTT